MLALILNDMMKEYKMSYNQAIQYVMDKNNVSYSIAKHYVESVLGLSQEL